MSVSFQLGGADYSIVASPRELGASILPAPGLICPDQ
jgi:hypothetical protein